MRNATMNVSWAACCNDVRGLAQFLSMEPAGIDIYATFSKISHALGSGAAKFNGR
jgi:hypothetical protein